MVRVFLQQSGGAFRLEASNKTLSQADCSMALKRIRDTQKINLGHLPRFIASRVAAHLIAVRSFVSLQLPLAPVRILSIWIELPDFMAVKRLQDPRARPKHPASS